MIYKFIVLQLLQLNTSVVNLLDALNAAPYLKTLPGDVSNLQNQYHSGQKFPALIQDEHNEHGWVSSLSSLQLSSSASVKTRQKTCTDAHQPGTYLCYELVTNDVITLTQSKSRKWMSSRARSRVCLQFTWFNSPRSKIKSTWAQQLSNSGVVMRSKHVNMDESWHLADTVTFVF